MVASIVFLIGFSSVPLYTLSSHSPSSIMNLRAVAETCRPVSPLLKRIRGSYSCSPSPVNWFRSCVTHVSDVIVVVVVVDELELDGILGSPIFRPLF